MTHTFLQRQAASTLNDRICRALPALTPSLRRMADYVLAHSFRAATMTIDELAEATQVSVATANRFAHRLGFNGFPAFRSELVRGFESVLAPVEKMRVELGREADCAEIVDAALADTQANLEAFRQSLPAEACARIVDAVLAARRVLVVGFGASAYLAGLLAHGLETHCEDVRSLAGVGGPGNGARSLLKLCREDVLIVIAFPRYVKDSIVIAEKARERGVRIVALTDTPTSPIAAFGDPTLYLPAANRFAATSEASVMAFIEALCAAVARRAESSIESATAMTELVLPWLYREGKNA